MYRVIFSLKGNVSDERNKYSSSQSSFIIYNDFFVFFFLWDSVCNVVASDKY